MKQRDHLQFLQQYSSKQTVKAYKSTLRSFFTVIYERQDELHTHSPQPTSVNLATTQPMFNNSSSLVKTKRLKASNTASPSSKHSSSKTALNYGKFSGGDSADASKERGHANYTTAAGKKIAQALTTSYEDHAFVIDQWEIFTLGFDEDYIVQMENNLYSKVWSIYLKIKDQLDKDQPDVFIDLL